MIERILCLMEERKITAAKLSKDLGLNSSAISEWKKGKSRPGTDAIIKIAEYLGVTTDYLLTGKEPYLKLLTNKKKSDGMERRIIDREATIQGLHWCIPLEETFGMYSDYDDPVSIDNRTQKVRSIKADIAKRARLSEDRLNTFIDLINMDLGDESSYPTADEYEWLMVATGNINEKTEKFLARLKMEQELLDKEYLVAREA